MLNKKGFWITDIFFVWAETFFRKYLNFLFFEKFPKKWDWLVQTQPAPLIFDALSVSEVKLDQKPDFDNFWKNWKIHFFRKIQKICEKTLRKILYMRFSMYQDPVNVTNKKKFWGNSILIMM